MADRAAFGFRNAVSKEVTWLTFEMSSTDLARRWALCVLRETRKRGLQVRPVGALYIDEPEVRAAIGRLGASLLRRKPDLTWDKEFPGCTAAAYIGKQVLHSVAETCRGVIADTSESWAVRSVARELVLWVRHYLTIYETDVHFHLSLQRELPWLVPLRPDDFKLFEADLRDGWLYLEYPTMGVASLAAYQAQSVVDIEPQRMFSSNCEIMYREDFEWGAKIDEVRRWVVEALGERGHDLEKTGRLAIGMLPLGRPTHGLSRADVRELEQSSDKEILFSYEIDGRAVTDRDIQSFYKKRWLRPNEIAVFWANRGQLKKLMYQIVAIWGERWRIRLFFLNQLWRIRLFFLNLLNQLYYRGLLQFYYASIMAFHRWRPVVVAWAHRMTWPIRKPYYFISYQFKKRILKRL